MVGAPPHVTGRSAEALAPPNPRGQQHPPWPGPDDQNVSRYCHTCLEGETAPAEPLLWPKKRPDGCDRESGVTVWAPGRKGKGPRVCLCVCVFLGISRPWAQR